MAPMQSEFQTPRLQLSPLTLSHSEFILELVNSPGWLQFIGDRNVTTVNDATDYIDRINQNEAINYWVVQLIDKHVPVGIITFIKREYLEHPDIGFAFLPAYSKMGYAFEAASAVLDYTKHLSDHILATTIVSNADSIKLLEKLGFTFSEEIDIAGEKLQVYQSGFTGVSAHQ